MRYLLLIKGDGRGHLTQALALSQLLQAQGHEISALVVGAPPQHSLPAFFLEKAQAPVHQVLSPNLVLNKTSTAIHWPKTIVQGLRQLGGIRQSARQLHALINEHTPDVIVNLYEPLLAVYRRLYKLRVPVVHISHQNLMLHPSFGFPQGRRLERRVVRSYTRMLVRRQDKLLGLSFYDMPDAPQRNIYTVAPLLRQEVYARQPSQSGHVLLYMVYPGLAEQVKAYSQQHPNVDIRAFYKKDDAPEIELLSPSLSFYKVHDERFLDALASCKGVVTTAGFETVCEAMYYGKPCALMPMPGQYEQYVNAFDAHKIGAGRLVDELTPGPLLSFLPKYQPQRTDYLNWLAHGTAKLLYHLEHPHATGHAPKTATLTYLHKNPNLKHISPHEHARDHRHG